MRRIPDDFFPFVREQGEAFGNPRVQAQWDGRDEQGRRDVEPEPRDLEEEMTHGRFEWQMLNWSKTIRSLDRSSPAVPNSASGMPTSLTW